MSCDRWTDFIELRDAAALAGVSKDEFADAVVAVWDRRLVRRMTARQAFLAAIEQVIDEPHAVYRVQRAIDLAGRNASVLIRMAAGKVRGTGGR